MTYWYGKILFITFLVIALGRCGSSSSSSSGGGAFSIEYELASEYVGSPTNTLSITYDGDESEYDFQVSSDSAFPDIEQNTLYPLKTSEITFTLAGEGLYTADFKVSKSNGEPFIHEILAWEFSEEAPDAPVISFSAIATANLRNNLQISDSRVSNTSEIWVGGAVSTTGQVLIEDEGYWQTLALETLSVPIDLTPGDGVKVVDGKFKNIFGNVSEDAIPAQIILKQTPPTDCDVVAQATTINDNEFAVKLLATDPYDVSYSVSGQVAAPVINKKFTSGSIDSIFLEATVGVKTINISIDDIAGNSCYSEQVTVTIDPNYQNEGIWIDDHTYWTDTESITIDVFFDHLLDQEPLELKISGSVSGANANQWIPYAENIPITINPNTSGSKTIFAQYRDTNGDESYLISKRIFLKPTITLQDAGAPFKDVIVSHILDAESLTITGCVESYVKVAYQATYTCQPNAATVDVSYYFPDTSILTKSAIP